jgi:LBP / BPI / CETP family, C-terminal domain
VQPFIPKLSAKYPDRPLSIGVHVSAAPVFTLSSTQGITLVGNASLPFEVTLWNGSVVRPCTLAAELTFGIDLGVITVNQSTVVVGNVTAFSTSFSQQSSSIGPVDINGLQDALNTLLSSVLIPLLDGFLTAGVTIPILPFGVELVNAYLQIADNYLLIASSFALNQPNL